MCAIILSHALPQGPAGSKKSPSPKPAANPPKQPPPGANSKKSANAPPPPPPGAPYRGQVAKDADTAKKAAKENAYPWAPATNEAAQKNLEGFNERYGTGYIPMPPTQPGKTDPGKPFGPKRNPTDGLGPGFNGRPNAEGKLQLQMSSAPTVGSVKHAMNRANQDPNLRDAANQQMDDRINVQHNQNLPRDPPDTFRHIKPED